MKIAFVCNVKFWESGEGIKTTMASRVRNIVGEVFLIYVGKLSKEEKEKIKKNFPIEGVISIKSFSFRFLRLLRLILHKIKLNKFYCIQRPFSFGPIAKRKYKRFIKDNNIEASICEYVWLSDLVLSERKTINFLDSYDIQHFFCENFRKIDKNWKSYIKEEDELNIARTFDTVICISQDDADYFTNHGIKVFYMPPIFENTYFKPNYGDVLNIGFVGGPAKFNVDAVEWFVNNVLDKIRTDKVMFNVYGPVCKKLPPYTNESISIRGFAEKITDVYDFNQVMINPTFMFGGIKTKNIEALCYGKIVLTTSEGCRGITNLIDNKILYKLDKPFEYVDVITKLLCNLDKINETGEESSKKVAKIFSKTVYDDFSDYLVKLKNKKNSHY